MANGYLNKPFGSEELVTTLTEVLSKSTLHRISFGWD
jgi:hypothetical protein